MFSVAPHKLSNCCIKYWDDSLYTWPRATLKFNVATESSFCLTCKTFFINMLNFNTRGRESVREEERGEKIQPAKKKRCFTLSKTCFPSVLENKRKQTRVIIEKKKKNRKYKWYVGISFTVLHSWNHAPAALHQNKPERRQMCEQIDII